MIYAFLIVPLLFAVMVYYKNCDDYWFFELKDFLIKYIVTFIICGIAIFSVDRYFYWNKVKDVEYLVSYVICSEYYEAYNKKVSCRHYIKNKEGKTIGYKHSYDVDEFDAEYYDITNTGRKIPITEQDYLYRKSLYKNQFFIELNREDIYKKDGDKYIVKYDNNIYNTINIAVEHEYENLVRVSNSVFTYSKADSSVVYNYPTLYSLYIDNNNFPAILTTIRPKDFNKANKLLQSENSKQGFIKQIKYWICLYPDKPVNVAIEQEKHWEGGNKNEFVTCIGFDSKTNKINWVKPFCWDNESLKSTVKNEIIELDSLDLIKVVNIVTNNGKKSFYRKPFAEFSYLDVSHVTLTEIIVIFVIMIVINIIVLFVVK